MLFARNPHKIGTEMVSIEILLRSKNIKGLVTERKGGLSPNALNENLVDELSQKNSISKYRIRLTVKDDNGKQVALNAQADLKDITKTGTIAIYVKDLGPQISWRTVYVIEYLGPLLIHPLIYFVQRIYGKGSYEHSETQWIAFWISVLHFLKREYETVYVHKFSNATMPAFNIFKNSFHYWILSGFNLAFFIYRPSSDPYTSDWKKYFFRVYELPSGIKYILALLWAFAELSNLKTHLTLSSLRNESNPRNYAIPYGYGFDLVSCPNYFFESLAWFFYACLVGNWSAWLFLIIATGQMWVWAVKRHKRYLKTFGDDYKKLKRAIYVPYLA